MYARKEKRTQIRQMKTNHTNSESKKTSAGALSQCPDKRSLSSPAAYYFPLASFETIRLIRSYSRHSRSLDSYSVKTRQISAWLGRIWQNWAERYSLGQVQTFQYSAAKGVMKKQGQNNPQAPLHHQYPMNKSIQTKAPFSGIGPWYLGILWDLALWDWVLSSCQRTGNPGKNRQKGLAVLIPKGTIFDSRVRKECIFPAGLRLGCFWNVF
jgi:hypothetical protein